ncbi:unannotated protein [freshwater metagenome]|uniref:Unannotated protein n=1 Tax=freshwater metagenome TaxID=449393 RepID=A0A6J6LH81_9ZZZZ
MCNLRDTFDVEHVIARVANCLAVEGLGVRTNCVTPFIEVVGIFDERCFDAELRERVVKEVVGAAVQRCRGNDVAARFGKVLNGESLSGLT